MRQSPSADERKAASQAKGPPSDPLEGREITFLNIMLANLEKQAKAGDGAAVDKVLKILELRRRYKRDARIDRME